MDEIRAKNWSLVPSHYIEFVDRDLQIDFHKEMSTIQEDMRLIMEEESKSQSLLKEAFKGIGYGID